LGMHGHNPECGIRLLPLVPIAYKSMQTRNCQCHTILENIRHLLFIEI